MYTQAKAGEKCPVCKQDTLVGGRGKLDQSGLTHLPCDTVECKTCGYKVWLKSTEPHQPNFPPKKD